MRTPAGKECQYFYGDYFRGRQREECRLLMEAEPPLRWTPELCQSCPVPEIALANACPNMGLSPSIGRSFPFLRRQVRVKAFCQKSGRAGFDSHIGCGECHALPILFDDASSEPDPSD